MTRHEPAGGDATESHTVTLQIGAKEPLRIALPSGDIPAEGILPALRTMTNAVIYHPKSGSRMAK
jgi:hypothetical protein